MGLAEQRNLVEGEALVDDAPKFGRRVKIRAESELLALHSAISYLRARFGSVSRDGQPCSLGGATVGMPVSVDDADADASGF